MSTASPGKARYPGAGMHDGRLVVAARGVGVGGADATIGLRLRTNSFVLAHGTPPHHSRCAMQRRPATGSVARSRSVATNQNLGQPATPSLPSMRGWLTPPCSTSSCHTFTQVKGTAEGWVVGRREAARSAVSGKFLADPCGLAYGTSAPSSRQYRPQATGAPTEWVSERLGSRGHATAPFVRYGKATCRAPWVLGPGRWRS